MTTPSTEIPMAGLLAGDAYLQQHTEEFNYWGGEVHPGACIEFVKSLLVAVFQASGIELRMPSELSPDDFQTHQWHQEESAQ